MRKVYPTIDVQAVRLRCSKFKDHIVPITELGTIDQYSLPITSRKAAVLIPLCMFKGLPSVLFTLRSSRVSTHKNQVSFPGIRKTTVYHTTTSSLLSQSLFRRSYVLLHAIMIRRTY
jgi:hypothetical protein